MAGTKKLLFFLFLCHGSCASFSLGSSNSTDELVLLSFKSVLSSGQSSILDSWNESSQFCNWPGVVCGRLHPDRVVALRMSSFNLFGSISPFLGNLSFLKELDLSDNQLVGRVPLELGYLSRLQLLNLSINHLKGSIPVTLGGCSKLKKITLYKNQLQGEIPDDIGNLKNLVVLNLQFNNFSGRIPHTLAGMISIRHVTLYNNRLSGEIPPFWGNLTNLLLLDLGSNMLSGAIPSSFGMLSSLSRVNLGPNNLSGSIPTSVWNISSLRWFSVQENRLSGAISPNAFDSVPHLMILYMDSNRFHGPIPASISNASAITMLQLGKNFFSGIIPQEVGRLKNLSFLYLPQTLLEAREPKDWEFVTALINCSQLQFLSLARSKFGGVLPDSLSNLSSSLTTLVLEDNRISGRIPKDIGNLINMQTLTLARNIFTGSLPSSIYRLKNLVRFDVHENKITGPVPLAIGNLTGLNYLSLFANDFSGAIPNTIRNLTKLSELLLSNNYLTGSIPSAIFNIPTLSTILDLSHNNLEGSLPKEIGNLKNLIEFHAESNNLSGQIPPTIGDCQLLQFLFLQNNTLNGSIPIPLSQLKPLEALDLSSNNLLGEIPKSLGNLTMLYYLNLSFNNFFGEVPIFGVFANITAISVQGNSKLCGGICDLHLPICSLEMPKRTNKIMMITLVICLVAILVIIPFFCKLLIWLKKNNIQIPSTHSMHSHPLISYSHLVKATNNFSATNLLGSGSFFSVYKGELLNGPEGESTYIVAVKVLRLQTPKALKTFTAECETLRYMRHRNLVKIVTICSSSDNKGNDFKAIVYDFMPNGSLEGWLHLDTNDKEERRYLNLLERVAILLDVAYALDYLHCHGPEPVVHCDLKSSNVLLDADMVAHVGDFGLAKILVEGNSLLRQSTSSIGFRGTTGYAAPEYGVGNMVSTQGDIYSYGILVLETVTGKRPTDSRFRQGLSLREYVDLALRNRVTDAADTHLSLDLGNELHTGDDSSDKKKIDSIVSLLKLGMSCTQELPSNRMPTGLIVKELLAIRDSLVREHRA